VEIKGVGSAIFTTESGEHRLLTGVYYIPALRNSIINLGQLDENGSRVEIKDGVMSRDGNSGTGTRYPSGTGTIFYSWVAPVPDPNRDGYFFPPAVTRRVPDTLLPL
jgi:hypothetical protein